ncbi:serine hydrolase domain-containing protein [Clavibacter zhangzhiyongii]|uniref:serine hydrolase domain-containing protein n=1 Tax=Clavibacter zhangzhiyongii TaxID=2768071 RepID=UPI0039E06352
MRGGGLTLRPPGLPRGRTGGSAEATRPRGRPGLARPGRTRACDSGRKPGADSRLLRRRPATGSVGCMDTTPLPPTAPGPAAARRPRRSGRLAALVGAVALALTLPLAAGAAAPAGAAGSAAPSQDPPPPAPPQHQPGGHDLTKADVDTWLDGVVGSALPTTGIPGAAVSVVADGQVLTTRGYGLADTGTEGTPARAVDPDDTLFRVGSVSKVVSATAVMQLVEEGRLDLDADVQQHLDFDLDTPKGAVTLRHLLTHTAGFEEVITGLIGVAGSERDLGDVMRTDPPAQVFVPGTTPPTRTTARASPATSPSAWAGSRSSTSCRRRCSTVPG